jgi:hypothetical protein
MCYAFVPERGARRRVARQDFQMRESNQQEFPIAKAVTPCGLFQER